MSSPCGGCVMEHWCDNRMANPRSPTSRMVGCLVLDRLVGPLHAFLLSSLTHRMADATPDGYGSSSIRGFSWL
ncbi:hypothetical protein GOBAR_AA00445 [Gossypium barbadense]|uniref:Uncharacterized protein n=1 Tax=Gossypium barbadense TaxID=3634 RepID=A0A2P5YX48_GOSBA|nr:hypothetical protein GOBAR_AA00445 [Gossypium barbadense]